jgi:cytochrome c biogenesis protein CcdA
MSVPFLAIGLGAARMRVVARTLARHGRSIQVASGALIVGVGLLVATNTFARLAGLVPWNF